MPKSKRDFSDSHARRDSRRAVLKSMVVGGGAAGAFSGLPTSWKKPMVASVMLPAHAQTTQVTGSLENCESGTIGGSGPFYYVYTLTVSGTTVYNAYYMSGTINGGVFSASGGGTSTQLCRDGDNSIYGATVTGSVGGTGTSSDGYRRCDGIQVSEWSGTGPVGNYDGSIFTFEVTEGTYEYCPDLITYTPT